MSVDLFYNFKVYLRAFMTALEQASRIMGSARNLASSLGVSTAAISKWKVHYDSKVPPHRVIPIFKLTGVTPHELRPDLYPNPTDGLNMNVDPANSTN